jgi:hypothetical protein
MSFDDAVAVMRRRGAMIGAGVGLVVPMAAVIGNLDALEFVDWWMALAIPSGALAGATVADWIRPGHAIPIRAIVVAAVISDITGVVIVSLGAAVETIKGPMAPESNLVIVWLADTFLGLVSWGVFALVPLLLVAWLAAWLLRRWATMRPQS